MESLPTRCKSLACHFLMDQIEPSTNVDIRKRNPQGRRSSSLGRGYTELEIRLALEMVAICAGNASEASRRLESRRGLKIPSSTINEWRRSTYAQEYEAVQFEVREQIDRAVIAEARDLVTELAGLERVAMGKTLEQLESGSVRDASGVLRNVSTSKAINLDKIALHEGRPTAIVENRTGEATLRALAAMGRMAVVDSTAEED